MQIAVIIMWGILGAFGMFHKAPKPTTDFHFTTYEACPFYRDSNGQTQVEAFVVCPAPEDQREMAEWKREEATGKFETTADLPVVDDKDLTEVTK